MKKVQDETLEKEPLAVGAKMLEMKNVSEKAAKGIRLTRLKDEIVSKKAIKKTVVKTANEPIPLKIKKTHSLGDFYGRFHPSKSTKGIKRSE